MAAAFYPKGSVEGLAEARRRIAEAKRIAAEELDIGGLGLTEIPEELFALSQLKVLYLGLPKAAAETPYCLRTEEDDHSENEIGDEGARALSQLVNLTSLNLGYNEIGDDGARALSQLVNLTSLNLRWNNIRADGAQALSHLVSLTKQRFAS